MILLNKLIKNSTMLILLFLFAINFLITFSLMNDGLFHHDSIALASATEKTYEKQELQLTANGRPSLVIINSIIYLPFYIKGMNADFSTRLSGILFHSLSILALFLFVSTFLSNKIIGLFASLLFSFNPLYISPNTYGKEHGMAIFFLLISFYILLLAIEKNKHEYLALSSFLFTFSIGIRESNIVLTPFYFLLYLQPKIQSKKIIFREGSLKISNLLFLFIPFLIVLFVWLKIFLYDLILVNTLQPNTGSGGVFLNLFSPKFNMVIEDILTTVPLLILFFFVCGILLFLYLSLHKRENLFKFLFLLAWTLLIFYFGNVSGYKARYLDLVFVPIFIFASYPLYYIYKKHKLIAVVILLYFIMSMFLFIYPILKFRHDYSGPKEFALWLKQVIEPDAFLISIDDTPPIYYYANISKQYNIPVQSIFDNDSITLKKWIFDLKKFLNNSTNKIYIISSALHYANNEILSPLLHSNFKLRQIGGKLTEHYNNADIRFNKYDQTLYGIENK
ncbi:MAG: glycosyltransferase family 39 protein [Nanoarchaeota archaeon]